MARLGEGLLTSGREVVFVVGSGLSAPSSADETGVPTVNGLIALLKAEFQGDELAELRAQVSSSTNGYQAACLFLHGPRGQPAVNGVIRRAVARTRNSRFLLEGLLA